jgi:pimeloyl-ACP methyl ester carboxylesterase
VSTVDVDGTRLDTRVHAGDRDLPAIVFLHEGVGCIELWRSFPEDVRVASDGPTTILYSRAGYGHSGPAALPRPVGYMHDEADRVLPAVLDRLGIERCVLVGHSDGASIALLAAGGAARTASRVAGLVLIAPHVFVEDATIEAIEAAREAFLNADLRRRLARYHDDVDGAFWGWNDVWLSPGFRGWDITDRLAEITCPVALVQGRADPYGTSAQLDAIAAGVRGPVDQTMIVGVGHAPHVEAPGPTVAATVALLREVATRSGRP